LAMRGAARACALLERAEDEPEVLRSYTAMEKAKRDIPMCRTCGAAAVSFGRWAIVGWCWKLGERTVPSAVVVCQTILDILPSNLAAKTTKNRFMHALHLYYRGFSSGLRSRIVSFFFAAFIVLNCVKSENLQQSVKESIQFASACPRPWDEGFSSSAPPVAVALVQSMALLGGVAALALGHLWQWQNDRHVWDSYVERLRAAISSREPDRLHDTLVAVRWTRVPWLRVKRFRGCPRRIAEREDQMDQIKAFVWQIGTLGALRASILTQIIDEAALARQVFVSLDHRHAEATECPEGHQLALALASRDAYCDWCFGDIAEGEPLMECRSCDWVLCGKCRPPPLSVGRRAS